MQWFVPKELKLSIEIWEGNAVVYHFLSGDTHYINELAVEVLNLLQAAPETVTSLTDKICLIFEVDEPSSMEQELRKLISEFNNLGLIESI